MDTGLRFNVQRTARKRDKASAVYRAKRNVGPRDVV